MKEKLVRLTTEQRKKLKQIKADTGASDSETIRRAIDQYKSPVTAKNEQDQ